MTQRRPDILLIFPDQWRGDGLSCLDNPLAETPFLDHIASGGVLFTAAYSNCPSCIAARACLMTGQTPATVGRHGYQDGNAWPYENVFPRLLRDAGYQTLLAGKTHFHPPRARLGFEEVALHDVMPTLLDAARVPIPPGVEGSSLLPLARGESSSWREYIAFEHSSSAIGPWQGLCDGKEKYIWQTMTGEEFLFDLRADSKEEHNLAGRPEARDRLAVWRRRLADHVAVYEADGLVKQGQLTPGHSLPAARPWLMP